MYIDFDPLSPNQRYHLLTQTIIPRPIAWVLSENDDASLNLAPFSFFNAMCSDPALLVMSIGKKPNGERKDTAKNIFSGREFVVHIANVSMAAAVTTTSTTHEYGVSELDDVDLALTEFEGGNMPRLENCDIAYRCTLYEHHLVGPNEQAFIYAQAHSVYLSDSVATQNDRRISVDASKVNPLSRLGGSDFADFGNSFTIKRPK